MREVLTDCTLCYHSCGCKVTVEGGKAVKVEGLESHPLNKGKLCPRGEAMLENIYNPDRLRYPMKRTKSGWERISWDQALTEIAEKLTTLKDEFGPSVLGVFSGSIGVENPEMAGLTQRFRAAFGSPNFFSVESLCYRMRIRTRQITFGKYPTEELDSNLYILWGHNPDESDFPLLLALKNNLEKGAKLVVIDPKRIPLADRADMYLKITPGTDGAMALAMINVIINEHLYDREFIESYTYGFDRLVPHIQAYTPEWAEGITWIPADDIRRLARLFATTKGAGIYQGTATQDQTANGTQNSRVFAINITSVEGQMEGSLSMGLGEALFEEVKFDEKGRILNPNLTEYNIPTALDMPNVKSIIVESNEPNGPFGAKEVGEGAILPTIPAILNAVYDATGVLIQELPLTPERVYLAIRARTRKNHTSET